MWQQWDSNPHLESILQPLQLIHLMKSNGSFKPQKGVMEEIVRGGITGEPVVSDIVYTPEG